VGSLDLLLDAPAVPRVLRLLMDKEGEDRHASIVEALPDKARTVAAIEALEAQGIIRRQDGFLKVVRTEEATRRIDAIILFYENVNRVERKKLLFRGILNTAQYACLIHFGTCVGLMESEGFVLADVEGMIDKDSEEGFVERIKIVYRARDGLPHKSFPFIPLYYYPHFISMKSEDTEHLKARLRHAGITMTEEEYLLGHYPKEIANQAREYINREKEHIRDRIKNEVFDIWWYYRF
jgi:hypothetical protein